MVNGETNVTVKTGEFGVASSAFAESSFKEEKDRRPRSSMRPRFEG